MPKRKTFDEPPKRPGLDVLIEASRTRVMTPRDKFEQRVSFVWGNAEEGATSTLDQVRVHIAEDGGYPEEYKLPTRE